MTIPDKETCTEYSTRILDAVAGCDTCKAGLLLMRPILEAIYKRLSSDSNHTFNGLFARMQYVHDAAGFPDWLVRQVNSLRIICNKAAHEEAFECDASQLDSAVYVMGKLLAQMQPDADLQSIEAYCQSRNAAPFPDLPPARRESFQCVVRTWKVNQQNNVDCALEITANNEDGEQVSILMKNSADKGEGRQWTHLAKALWPYAVLACYNLTCAQGRENSFLGNPSSLLVLEPDYLMDASSIADCFSSKGMHPELYIINRIMTEGGSESLMKGSVTNDIFDTLVLDPTADYDEMFRQSLAKHPMSMVALGKQVALDTHSSIREGHLPQLISFARDLQGVELQLEPTFICPRYGLQGRLDLLFRKDGKHYIVELKSGKPPVTDVWPQHKMQVTAYNMIIRGCYGSAKLGSSSILYSADTQSKLRHVVNTIAPEQDLLMCRNRIVGIMHSLSQNPARFFDWIRGRDPANLSGFILDKYNKLRVLLSSLEPYEYEWLMQQVKLTVREAWFAKTGSNGTRDDGIYGYNALWQQSRAEKIRHYKIITGMKPRSTTVNELHFRMDEGSGITDFRLGDIVVLYREDKPIDRQEILRGSLIALADQSLAVRIRGGLNRAADFVSEQTWCLEHDMLESTLLGPLNSIRAFLEGSPSMRAKILGLQRPEHDPSEPSQDYIGSIVARMCAARDYFVVQGPPGTGKTSGLITSFIKKLHRDTNQTVLVLSFTNRAVDEICLNLDKHAVPYIRTGLSTVIDDHLLGNIIAGKKFDAIESTVRANRVWVSTVQSCNSWIDDLLRICGQIDTLVIDEASQIIENTVLGIVARAGRTILIGDQNQLPPIVVQGPARYEFTRGELLALEYSTFNRSLMERLWLVANNNGWTDSREMLNRHFRMHDDIASLVQDYYSGRLVSRTDRQREPLPSSDKQLPALQSRKAWIECPPSPTAYYDDLQVEIVFRLLERYRALYPNHDIEKSFGIVSPYRAMIHALRKKLGSTYASITIDTVERFQGSERDNIIIVLPLQNPSSLRTMEAVSDDGMIDRKLNVALSRARERVILLGNALICRSAPHYAELIDKISSSGTIIPAEQVL